MPFGQEDFVGNTLIKLTVIINHKMGNPLLSSFRDLTTGKQKKFNKLMNEYIYNDLANCNDWEEKLTADFNDLVNTELLHEKFQPEKVTVPILVSKPELLITPEQKEFIESDPEAIKYDFSKDFTIKENTE